jgi:hypothetical protein
MAADGLGRSQHQQRAHRVDRRAGRALQQRRAPVLRCGDDDAPARLGVGQLLADQRQRRPAAAMSPSDADSGAGTILARSEDGA